MAKEDHSESSRRGPSRKAVPDSLDLRLLKLLREDARLSAQQIGRRVGLTRQAVSARIRWLTESGYIARFTVDLDWDRLDYELPVLIFVKHKHLPQEEYERLMELATKADEARDVFSLSGEPGFAIFGLWKNKAHYSEWKRDFLKDATKKTEVYGMEEFVVWGWRKRGGWIVAKGNGKAQSEKQ